MNPLVLLALTQIAMLVLDVTDLAGIRQRHCQTTYMATLFVAAQCSKILEFGLCLNQMIDMIKLNFYTF